MCDNWLEQGLKYRLVEKQPAIFSALTMDKNLRSHVNKDMAMLIDDEQKMNK